MILPEGGEVNVPVFGWDPFPGAGAAAVGVAEERLLVMPPAEVAEVLQLGDLGAAEGVAVVGFQVPADLAAGNDARGIADVEGRAEVGGDGAAGVSHRHWPCCRGGTGSSLWV